MASIEPNLHPFHRVTWAERPLPTHRTRENSSTGIVACGLKGSVETPKLSSVYNNGGARGGFLPARMLVDTGESTTAPDENNVAMFSFCSSENAVVRVQMGVSGSRLGATDGRGPTWLPPGFSFNPSQRKPRSVSDLTDRGVSIRAFCVRQTVNHPLLICLDRILDAVKSSARQTISPLRVRCRHKPESHASLEIRGRSSRNRSVPVAPFPWCRIPNPE